ncbi:hypothetical protein C9374_001655 [Naegleria lovaniensis]|uniref:Uncharacterized protein n=1 Tax=Naegleria lovaniensis TaxID=51637 RepID=A0AA88KM61_NAELO|nr:uncharacterized protein C9374_001655 [Naegleria lovaniensis]KAG2387323.1 hypothetical protein C9374_001655 [Naegleria lovaniensis]
MHPLRSSILLAVIGAIMMFVMSQVQAQYQLNQVFAGLTCGGKAVVSVYTTSSSCKNVTCSTDVSAYVGSFSSTTACSSTMRTKPVVGEYMMTFFRDSACSGTPSSSSIISLDTCIPAANQTYGSVMYKGCKNIVTYTDRNCQTEQMTAPIANIDCMSGIQVQCSGAAQLFLHKASSIFMMMMIAVLMVLFM